MTGTKHFNENKYELQSVHPHPHSFRCGTVEQSSRTVEQLQQAGVETKVFDGVAPNPTVANSEAGAEAAR